MRYFTVQAINSLQQKLLEIDIPLSQFWPLLDEIEKELRTQGIFGYEDDLLKRLVPRSELSEEGVTVELLVEVPTNLGEMDCALYFEEEPGEQPQPIQALSIWFYSQITGKVCSVNLPFKWLFRSAQEHLSQQLAHRQQVDRADELDFLIFLQGQEPVSRPRTRRLTAVVVLQPGRVERSDRDTLDEADLSKSLAEIAVTDRESLVTPIQKSWQSYRPEKVGTRQRGDLRVLISRQAIEQLESALNNKTRDSEIGGFLIGDVCQDEDESLFVDISDIFTTEQAGTTFFDLRFSRKSWQQVFEKIKQRFPGKRRLGWYRTDLFRSGRDQTVNLYESAREQVYDAERGSFIFSSTDIFLHQNLFPEAWHVAMLIDVRREAILVYQWKKGEVTPCQGFYVYNQAALP